MKRTSIILAVVSVVVVCVLPLGKINAVVKPPEGLTVKASLVRVLDGDTLEAEVRFRVTVRLLDCWAPETRTLDLEEKALGLESKRYLEKMLEDDEEIILFIPSNDINIGKSFTFGRVLGHVWDDDSPKSVSVRMVEAGKATVTK